VAWACQVASEVVRSWEGELNRVHLTWVVPLMVAAVVESPAYLSHSKQQHAQRMKLLSNYNLYLPNVHLSAPAVVFTTGCCCDKQLVTGIKATSEIICIIVLKKGAAVAEMSTNLQKKVVMCNLKNYNRLLVTVSTYRVHSMTRAIKLPSRMMLPPGEHNRVSVYAGHPNGKESQMIVNPQKNLDCHENRFHLLLGPCPIPPKISPKSLHWWRHTNGQTNGGDTQSRNLRKKLAQVSCASFLHQICVQVHASSADDTSNKNGRSWTKQITYSILPVDHSMGTQNFYLNNLKKFKNKSEDTLY